MDLNRISQRVAAAVTDVLTNSLSQEAMVELNIKLAEVRGPGKAAEVLAEHGLELTKQNGRSWTVKHEKLESPLRTHHLWMDSDNRPSLEPKKGGEMDWDEIERKFGPFTEKPEE